MDDYRTRTASLRTSTIVWSGLRVRWGDVCTLGWSEIDLDKRQLRLVPNKTKKRGRELVFPFQADFGEYLLKLAKKGTEGSVWPAIAKRYADGDRRLYEELRELFTEAGMVTRREARPEETRKRNVMVYGFHSLRHTYVTLLEESGMDRETIQTLVGHGSPEMTAHYSHSLAAGRKAAGRLPGLGETAKTK